MTDLKKIDEEFKKKLNKDEFINIKFEFNSAEEIKNLMKYFLKVGLDEKYYTKFRNYLIDEFAELLFNCNSCLKCIKELETQTERITKIDNEIARKREMDEYNKKIAKLEELFNCNTDVLVQLENLRLTDKSIHKIHKYDKEIKTIFEGLNLRSENFCNQKYHHNFPLGLGTYILDYYYNKNFVCTIKRCHQTFVFNKYFTLWQCYYSINGNTEKSTGPPNIVIRYKFEPGIKINTRSHEIFNFYLESKLIYSIKFPKKNKVEEFKEEVKNKKGIELLSLYGFQKYSDVPKLMKDSDNFECGEGFEFNIELSQNLTIVKINNSINYGIKYFKAEFNYIKQNSILPIEIIDEGISNIKIKHN